MYLCIIVYAMPLWGRREKDNVFDFERPYIKGEYALQLKNILQINNNWDFCLHISMGIPAEIYIRLKNWILF